MRGRNPFTAVGLLEGLPEAMAHPARPARTGKTLLTSSPA
jgi:hypothetical protein